MAVFQALGLFVGLWLVGRSLKKPSLPYLLLAALILAAWMLPRHKLFDISISIMAIAALAYLIQRPTPRVTFWPGSTWAWPRSWAATMGCTARRAAWGSWFG